jgi:hypothetical protein
MRAGSLAFVPLLLAGCSSTVLPNRPPDIIGIVKAVEPRILVGEPTTTDLGAMVFWTDDDTRVIIRAPDGTRARGTLADIVIGVTVRAWAEHVVDSYPAKAYAAAFEIL